MKIVAGKHAGCTATLHQFANDWMTVDVTDGPRGLIVKPTMVRLEDDEYWRMRESFLAYQQRGDRSCGRFWAEWELNTDGTFARANRPAQTSKRGSR